jgi:hypothetical protein
MLFCFVILVFGEGGVERKKLCYLVVVPGRLSVGLDSENEYETTENNITQP